MLRICSLKTDFNLYLFKIIAFPLADLERGKCVHRERSFFMKKWLSVILVMSSMFTMMTTAFAADTNSGGKRVYSITVDAEALSEVKERTNTVNLGISLGGGRSGWSPNISTDFSFLPANAKVESVTVSPGQVSTSGGATSTILVTKLAIISPKGHEFQTAFNKHGMETLSFFGEQVSGTWKLKLYGQNLGTTTGGLTYKSTRVTITYTVE